MFSGFAGLLSRSSLGWGKWLLQFLHHISDKVDHAADVPLFFYTSFRALENGRCPSARRIAITDHGTFVSIWKAFRSGQAKLYVARWRTNAELIQTREDTWSQWVGCFIALRETLFRRLMYRLHGGNVYSQHRKIQWWQFTRYLEPQLGGSLQIRTRFDQDGCPAIFYLTLEKVVSNLHLEHSKKSRLMRVPYTRYSYYGQRSHNKAGACMMYIISCLPTKSPIYNKPS